MHAELAREHETDLESCPHPNDVDRKRIERALQNRARYRYVTPVVRPTANGYRIESPCCSRNIDPDGGDIDIARLEYQRSARAWRLYRMQHTTREWQYYAEFATLDALLEQLNHDPERLFWQ
jgi:hypothetical protein